MAYATRQRYLASDIFGRRDQRCNAAGPVAGRKILFSGDAVMAGFYVALWLTVVVTGSLLARSRLRDGKAVKKQLLKNGDIVEIGKYKIKYVSVTVSAGFEKAMGEQGRLCKACGA